MRTCPADRPASAAAASAVERALLGQFRARQKAATESTALAIKLNHWGLFSALNTLARTILHAVAADATLCLRAERAGPNGWPYFPSPRFEARHNCSSFACYLDVAGGVDLFPPGCDGAWARARGRGAEPQFNLVRDGSLAALRRRFGGGASPHELRGIVARWLFVPAAATRAHVAAQRARVGLDGAAPWVSLHVRWGDKLNEEGRRVGADEFVAAARPMMRRANASRLFLATSSPRAVAEVRGALAPTERLCVPNLTRVSDDAARRHKNHFLAEAAAPESSFLDAYSDVWTILQGAGAVVTYSSNIGRFVYWHNLRRIDRGDFAIASLDGVVEAELL